MSDTETDSETTFATAPWEATNESAEDRSVTGGGAVWDSKGDLVCSLTSDLAGDGSIEKAFDRACLIAAAPDLLEVARRFIQYEYGVDDPAQFMDDIETAKAAIAKAEGKD